MHKYQRNEIIIGNNPLVSWAVSSWFCSPNWAFQLFVDTSDIFCNLRLAWYSVNRSDV